MKTIQFRKATIDNWGDRQAEISNQVRSHLGSDFDVIFKKVSDAKDIPTKDVFVFRESNKDNLMDIRASVGKRLTAKIQDPNFVDFQVKIEPIKTPSEKQRAYYFGVILPAIQDYFKEQGNFMDLNKLDEDIRGSNCRGVWIV